MNDAVDLMNKIVDDVKKTSEELKKGGVLQKKGFPMYESPIDAEYNRRKREQIKNNKKNNPKI